MHLSAYFSSFLLHCIGASASVANMLLLVLPLAFPTLESPPCDTNSCELFFERVLQVVVPWQDAR